ncbi:hypothetical protein GTP46_06080 [Duganella sp. FT135W]|uniref:Uncharacterized protein n=1 Tax=Duganella flavida TaxID=2692175 RepID=A0A6L8K6N7_9BURK|nr:hypothetical protein [Duganella flavida]MYM22207.1 hypothetical protein [Duganella flavida]
MVPQLAAGPALDRQQLAVRLAEWFATLPRNITVACASFTDWELLLDALDGSLPANQIGRYDLRAHSDSAEFNHAFIRYNEQSAPWHHALHDARAHRQGWLAWQGKGKTN